MPEKYLHHYHIDVVRLTARNLDP